MPLAASPEFPPDPLWLYLEPDFVISIDHSIRQAIDVHNEEQRRRQGEDATRYRDREVCAYAATSRSL